MRIHTSATLADVREAARRARVSFDRCSEHGSRTAERAFDVTLFGASTRRPNSGARGAGDDYAATWDQWGVFFGHLYQVDPAMVCGSGRHPVYASADDYAWKTDERFAPGGRFDVGSAAGETPALQWVAAADCPHRWQFDGIAREQSCARCDSVRRFA